MMRFESFAKDIVDVSKKYEDSQSHYIRIKNKLLKYESRFNVKPAISRKLIDDNLQRLKEELSTIFTSLGHLQTNNNSLTEFHMLKELSQELDTSDINAEKIQLYGIIEVCHRLLAELKIRTANPYFSTDELLARLTEFEKKLILIESERIENKDINQLILTCENIAERLWILKTQILAERKRKTIKSLFWPLVTLSSILIMILNIIPGTIDIVSIGILVVFSIVFIALFFIGLLGPILCALKVNKKSGALRFLLSFVVVPIALLIAVNYGDFARVTSPSLEKSLIGLMFSLFVSIFFASSFFEEAEEMYKEILIKKALDQTHKNIFNRTMS